MLKQKHIDQKNKKEEVEKKNKYYSNAFGPGGNAPRGGQICGCYSLSLCKTLKHQTLKPKTPKTLDGGVVVGGVGFRPTAAPADGGGGRGQWWRSW